jgi:arylsulfatase A-like enzyme
MPRTRRAFWDKGTRFANAFATTPLCCPSRASIFTGMYQHNHGVTSNLQAVQLPQRRTMQRYLHSAGYKTAIVGKYFNAWPLENPPPHFDRWATTVGGYYGSKFNIDGRIRKIEAYSTTFMRAKAVRILEQLESRDPKPWFLYIAVSAPHTPRTPEPRFEDAEVPPWEPGTGVLESDVSDKPPFLSSRERRRGAAIRRQQLRTLMSVDRLVKRVFRVTSELGEKRRTLAFFLSDNGFLLGEHGYAGKRLPYTESVSIPIAMRWPGRVASGVSDDRLVANIDVAATALDAAGVTPQTRLDGRSLLDGSGRERILLEYRGKRRPIRSWASIRTHDYQYTQWFGRPGVIFREFYDLETDPAQLDNLLADGDPSNDPDVGSLSLLMRADRQCLGETCP